MNKWYMHNLESVLENEMYKILWDFEMEIDHLISIRLSDSQQQQRQQKENLSNSGLCRFGRPLNKTEGKRKKR